MCGTACPIVADDDDVFVEQVLLTPRGGRGGCSLEAEVDFQYMDPARAVQSSGMQS